MTRGRKIGLAAVAVLVVAAAGAAGAQFYAQHTAQQRVDEALASLPAGETGHYDGLHYNLFQQRLHLTNLIVNRGDKPIFSAARVTVIDPSGGGTADQPFAASQVNVTGLTLASGGRQLKLSSLALDNPKSLSPGVAPPDGTPAWPSLPQGGTLISADHILAQGLHVDNGATLGVLEARDYRLGRIHTISLTDFHDSEGDQFSSAAAEDIDLAGLDRIFNAARYQPGAPGWTERRPLLTHLVVTAIALKAQGGGTAALAQIGVDGLTGRPFLAAPGAPQWKEWATGLDAAQAIAVDGVTLKGFTLSMPDHDGVALAALTLSHYADGVLGNFGFDGLSVTAKGTQVATKHFELDAIDTSGLLKKPVPGAVADLFSRIGSGDVSVGGLALEGLGVTGGPGNGVALDSLKETVTKGNPLRVDLALRGLSLPASIATLTPNPLQLLGLDKLVLDANEIWLTDTAKGEATIQQAQLVARGLATLDITGKLVDLPLPGQSVDQVLEQAAKAAVSALSVKLTNDTLVQRVYAAMAKEQGKTTDDIRQEATLGATLFASMLVPQQKDASDQIAAFLTEPKTITITAHPATPVPFAAFDNPSPDEIQKALNLSVQNGS